ncbi:MAG TPA: hypothetical protein VJA66_07545 [Thermoanaerobaculia bacterium]
MKADRHDRCRQTFRRLTFIAALGIGLLRTAIIRADSVVILGAGKIGNWITTGFVANPNSSQTDLIVAPSPVIATLVPCSPPAPCPYSDVSLPALGSASLPFSFAGFDFGTVYVTQQQTPGQSGQVLPIVEASLNENDGCRSGLRPVILVRAAEIPVVPLSKLKAANLGVLNFPRAMSFPEGIGFMVFNNLVLGNIQRDDGVAGEDLPLLLELFDGQGNLLGSTTITLSYGETLVFGDVSFLNSQPGFFYGGQLRVTRISGKALMWGILYTIDSELGVTASTGVNLSP